MMNKPPNGTTGVEINKKQLNPGATCPTCGSIYKPTNVSRNKVVLFMVGAGWTFVLWILFLFIGGFIIGIMNVETAEASGEKFGEMVAFPALLFFGILSTILTFYGILPGTRKAEAHTNRSQT